MKHSLIGFCRYTKRFYRLVPALALIASLGAIHLVAESADAQPTGPGAAQQTTSGDDELAEAIDEEAAAEEIYDPLEPVNRGIFWFNDKFDIYVFEPVAETYDDVVPTPIRDCIANFFTNIRFPSYFVSSLLQLKFEQTFEHTGRFLLNTTLGVGGLFDPATKFGLPHHHEDFGTALGHYGVGPGFYLVLPILGPSNLRDAFGKAVDTVLNPTYYVGQFDDLSDDAAFAISAGLTVIDGVETRAQLLEAVKSAKDASVDYYLFSQAAYYQIRRNQIEDIGGPDGKTELEIDDEPFEDETFEDGPSEDEPVEDQIE